MPKTTTAERLHTLMEERGLRQADIIDAALPICLKRGVKLSPNSISQYVAGKVSPRPELMEILSEVLNVPEAWLAGYDVPRKGESKEPIEEYQLLYRQLSAEEKIQITKIMKGLILLKKTDL